ncbi:MAG: hypothetical protein IPI50_05940 [Saprospiraceae bacterium]|nr:hypothetical protein [Saprospiraceae bacterium]
MKFSFEMLFIVLIIGSLTKCKDKNNIENMEDLFEDPIVAEFKDQKLKLSDISSMMPQFESSSDSIQFLSHYSEKWLKDLSFLEKAKMESTSTPEIDALVEDYKNSLLLTKYEEKLINSSIDSQVTEKELLNYYDQKKGEYKLDESIIRLMFVKISKSGFDEKAFDPLWNKSNDKNQNELLKYCQNNAELFLLQPDKWYKWKEIADILPSKFISQANLHSGMQREFADFKFHYFIKIKEVVRPNEKPPISYFSMQAEKSILHDRAKNLIEKEKQIQYEKMLNQKIARQHIK